MSSERVTEAELARSRKARAIAKNWLEAETTRLELAGLDPALGDGAPGVQLRPSKFGRPSPLDRVREARISGMEIKSFEQGLGESTRNQQMPDPNRPIDALKEIAAFGLRIGKKPEEIEEVVQRLAPIIMPLGSLAGDQIARESVYARAFSEQRFGFNEMIQTLNSINAIRPQSERIDVAGMMNAFSNAVRTGAELGSSKNSSSVDPVALLQQSHEAQLQMFERLVESKESNQPKTLRDQLVELKEVGDVMGKLAGQEPAELATKRLDVDLEKWRHSESLRSEERRSQQQTDMIKTIGSSISKALETPAARNLGRSLADKISNPQNTQRPAPTPTPNLNDPLQEQFGFTCTRCKTPAQFSRAQLSYIETSPSRSWVCPACGEFYRLGGGAGVVTGGGPPSPPSPPPTTEPGI